MRRAVVTGGAGFIGSHLVPELLGRGVSVLVLDNFAVGRKEHVSGWSNQGHCEVVAADIRKVEDLEVIKRFEPDVVFHLAALHFIPYCKAHPQETLDVNVLGTDLLLRLLRNLPLGALVFASSAAIYGFSDEPHSEESPPRPVDVYGLSKQQGEGLVWSFSQERPDVRVVTSRLFNVYGPRETNPHVLPYVMELMKAGEQRIELGNTWPKRDLLFARDAAEALVLLASGPAGSNVFNLGTGIGTTVEDAIADIRAISGLPLVIDRIPERMREDDGHLVSDSSKIKAATGWRPRYELKEGLAELLRWEGLIDARAQPARI
jgi:UDP-glucose 4-epimerase